MKPRQDTRQKLLETAVDLIWSQSYGSIGVDEICKRAGVLKGSFYHFFPSKSDLAVAAIEDYWQNSRRLQMDQIFNTDAPASERFAAYCNQVYRNQQKRFRKMGKVGGCPFTCLGVELSTQDEKIRKKCQQLAARIRGYYESALRDESNYGAQALAAKAQELYALVTGMLLQARIQNNLDLIKGLKPAFLRLLATEEKAAA